MGKPTWIYRCRLEDNNKMYINEVGYQNVNWINLTLYAVQTTGHVDIVIRFRIPQKIMNLLNKSESFGL
jgi:agmatine/peptidylarginine deiminase